MDPDKIVAFSATELHGLVEAGQLDPVDVVDAHLERIAVTDASISAFVEVYADEARGTAASQRDDIRRGRPGGILRGVPIAAKDLYDIAGKPTRSGSRASSELPKAVDSVAIARLREAGAIVLGKTATHEYAFGVSTPPTRNPWDLDTIPGGSSGGSGAAIAASNVPLALGTDTGGSIRIPAALCGVVGMKATYGRVSKRGVTVLSWSLDHAGPLAASVPDAALALNALAGHDPADPYSARQSVVDYTAMLDRGVDGLKLGVSEHYFTDRLTADVAASFEAAVATLEQAGAIIVPVRFRDIDLCADIMRVISTVECASYHKPLLDTVPELFGDDVVDAVRIGMLHSGVAYVDALRARSRVVAGMAEMFGEVDALLSPTISQTAPRYGSAEVEFGGETVDILSAINALTVPANVTGMPALTVPSGLGRDGLPIGLQIMTAPFEEQLAFAIGGAFERLAPFERAIVPALQRSA